MNELLKECYVNTNNNNKQKTETIDGSYVYEDNTAKISIDINGTRWNGKIMIKTGMGSSYDNRNAKYPSGKIRENDLYIGPVRVGSISGANLYYSAFGQTVTLDKE
jgi:hypothetical protein